ncbi:MAG: glycoside hydrolase family 15 protein [Rhodospirillaceae bacterium]|nr:glycoside hydrolase family 15 protein [Rhodospirillaceae bacterium]
MLRSISATGLTKRRPGFGQTVVPAPGSVLAAPTVGEGPEEPDYFFHWIRDSAVVMEAVAGRVEEGDAGADWTGHLRDMVRFSLATTRLSGAALLRARDVRRGVQPEFLRYLRPEAELAAVEGERVLGEVRYNPDGSLDVIHWSRPQHDGPALRALAAMRVHALGALDDDDGRQGLEELILADLDYTERHCGEPCYDLWEEERGRHYYTGLVQHAALRRGAAWAGEREDRARAERYAAAARALAAGLDAFWSDGLRIYRCTLRPPGAERDKVLDSAVVLGVIHAGLPDGRHSPLDDRVQATLLALERRFAADYAVNRGRPAGLGVAMGRFPGDRYFTGGPWYIAGFAAAELHYRLAELLGRGAVLAVTPDNLDLGRDIAPAAGTPGARLPRAATERHALVRALIARGDAVMAMMRRYIPASGELSEQFDPDTGAQTSARDLSWSYAAFLTARDARRRALRGA